MDKCLCDVCCKNEANHRFKVKRLQPTIRGGLHKMAWVRIDICDSCYHMLLNAKMDKEG